MKYSVNNCGKYGLNTDIEQTDLPPEAWSSVNNARCQYNWIGSIGGHESISDVAGPFTGFGHYIISLQTVTTYYLVYPCDTDSDGDAETIYQFDGSSHTEITRASGDYTGTSADRWNGCNFQGIVILNNGVDAPQYWAGTGNCANMIWDGTDDWENYDGAGNNYYAKVIRPFKNFLFALRITENTDVYPQMVHWSDAAEPGVMPSTWDYASTTNLSGRVSLADTPGEVLDALTLRGSLVIYKEDSVYLCNYVEGNSIFTFNTLFIDRGLYSTDCCIDIGGKHVVLGDSSLYMHDGHAYKDILSGKNADILFADIEPSLYTSTFLAHNRAKTEVWVCYPSVGSVATEECNRALIWNYEINTWVYADIPNLYHAITGIVASSSGDAWNSEAVLTWDSESEAIWDDRAYSPIGDTFIGISDDLYQFDSGNQSAGVNTSVLIERTGIDLGGTETMNMVTAIYPRIEGDALSIRVGSQETIDGAVTWSTPQTFTPGTTKKLDFRNTGYFHAVQFLSDANVSWKLDGYDLHYEFAGER